MKKDHIKAGGNSISGKAKEMAGKATGDKSLEAEGKAQQIKAKLQDKIGDVKDALD